VGPDQPLLLRTEAHSQDLLVRLQLLLLLLLLVVVVIIILLRPPLLPHRVPARARQPVAQLRPSCCLAPMTASCSG
jgi:hypothetical protein